MKCIINKDPANQVAVIGYDGQSNGRASAMGRAAGSPFQGKHEQAKVESASLVGECIRLHRTHRHGQLETLLVHCKWSPMLAKNQSRKIVLILKDYPIISV
jgi:hypothetical protein